MNKKERPFSLKGKGAAVGIVLCFVAVIVMVGAYTLNNYEKRMGDQLAKVEQQTEKKAKVKSEETTTNDIVLPEAEGNTSMENNTEDNTGSIQNNAAASTQTTGNTTQINFNENSLLTWPSSGATLIGYSMDKTVYFSTLEQYKYNPALVIGGEVGEMIGASAPGVVTNIEESAQTGTTVTLDMGNGYSAVYGQLKDVAVQIGDFVDTGHTVGYLNDPTKYYSVEGPNLYFEVRKDGTPVNPLDFMEP